MKTIVPYVIASLGLGLFMSLLTGISLVTFSIFTLFWAGMLAPMITMKES